MCESTCNAPYQSMMAVNKLSWAPRRGRLVLLVSIRGVAPIVPDPFAWLEGAGRRWLVVLRMIFDALFLICLHVARMGVGAVWMMSVKVVVSLG